MLAVFPFTQIPLQSWIEDPLTIVYKLFSLARLVYNICKPAFTDEDYPILDNSTPYNKADPLTFMFIPSESSSKT